MTVLIALLTRRRLHLFGRRIHHGLTGLALIAMGAALCLDDIADRSLWVRDFRRRG